MMNGLAHGGGSVLASSLDFRLGCEHVNFRFLAAAYGRINSTWTLPNQIGWPMAKELLFSGRVVEAEEAYRIGLLNHLVPCEQLRPKTMEIATTIAKHRRESVQGIKELLLQHMGCDLRQMWANEKDFTTTKVKGYGVEEAFPEFLERKGR
jgi:2-(1,2-epoxy-1,2-dihydrophenyl)acetyl-CoA isomerase